MFESIFYRLIVIGTITIFFFLRIWGLGGPLKSATNKYKILVEQVVGRRAASLE